MKSALQVVGLGEVLWDMLPGGRQLGGAPTNFAYMTSLLGDEGVVASRVGDDPLGADAVEAMHRLGLNTDFLQRDPRNPTGTAEVDFDQAGQPHFTITEPVAWDFLESTSDWERLSRQADVICFGTLAQRSPTSRATLRSFLRLAEAALRVFDVNLRQPYFSAEVLQESLRLAHIVKVNHEELPQVARLVGVEFENERNCAQRLLRAYSLKVVCVTRGADGSLLLDGDGVSESPGVRVTVADTVGAGDAFTACLAHHYLRGAPLEKINEVANRFAAWVASQPGGTPALAVDARQQFSAI
jgi:fructokinase